MKVLSSGFPFRHQPIRLAAATAVAALAVSACVPLVGPPAAPQANIGSARMADNGDITLDLIARERGGAIGHARFVYSVTDPKHREIVEHLGGLAPGEVKAVPPWPR